MKKVMLLAVVAVMACVAMGAEAKKTVWQLWSEGGWGNWTEVIKAAESGAVEVKGQEWVVLLAKYETKAITAEEYWKQSRELEKEKFTGVQYTETACRICKNEPTDSPIVATVRAEVDKAIADKDEKVKKNALTGKARIYLWADKDYYQAFLAQAQSGQYLDRCCFFATYALNADNAKAPEIYKGLSGVILKGVGSGNAAKVALATMNKAAILANIPPAEVVSTLTTIQRLYADKAVGDSKEAKAWGIFLGSLRDVIASWK